MGNRSWGQVEGDKVKWWGIWYYDISGKGFGVSEYRFESQLLCAV